MEQLFHFPYRTALPTLLEENEPVLEGDSSWEEAKALFGNKIDNHIVGVFVENGLMSTVWYSDNRLYKVDGYRVRRADCGRSTCPLDRMV